MEKEKPGLFSRILQSKLEPQVVDVMFILHHLASHHLTCTNISDFTHGETEIQLLQSLSLLGKKKKTDQPFKKHFEALLKISFVGGFQVIYLLIT